MSLFVGWPPRYGPNFRRPSTKPFFYADGVEAHDNSGRLLEVRSAIGYFQKNTRMCDFVKHMIIEGKLSKLRLLNILDCLNLLNFYWLSPELSGGKDMVKLLKILSVRGINF